MSDQPVAIETLPEPHAVPETEITLPLIEEIYRGDCPSLSGRSCLTYAFGRHADQQALLFRLVANSGSGMFSGTWIGVAGIEALITHQLELTSKSFQSLYQGKSINSSGFLMAVLKDLGVIRPNVDNSRLHEHVPGQRLEEVVMARIEQGNGAVPSQPSRRKAKGG